MTPSPCGSRSDAACPACPRPRARLARRLAGARLRRPAAVHAQATTHGSRRQVAAQQLRNKFKSWRSSTTCMVLRMEPGSPAARRSRCLLNPPCSRPSLRSSPPLADRAAKHLTLAQPQNYEQRFAKPAASPSPQPTPASSSLLTISLAQLGPPRRGPLWPGSELHSTTQLGGRPMGTAQNSTGQGSASAGLAGSMARLG